MRTEFKKNPLIMIPRLPKSDRALEETLQIYMNILLKTPKIRSSNILKNFLSINNIL